MGVHLIALRLAFAEKEAKKAKTDDAVKFETRAFARRVGEVEDVVQVSLERDRLKYRWGLAGKPMRLQAMKFNTEADARRAYFTKLAELGREGVPGRDRRVNPHRTNHRGTETQRKAEIRVNNKNELLFSSVSLCLCG